MKILEVIQSLASGGAERLVVDLCNEMSKTEDVTLLLLKKADHYYLPQISERVKVIQANIPVGFNISQLFDCVKFVKEINPDVIHIHDHARYTMILANLLLCNKYKFYLTIHSDVELNYSKGLSGLQVRLYGKFGHCHFITISENNHRQFAHCHPSLEQKCIPNGRSCPVLSDEYGNVKKEMDDYRENADTILFVHVARFNPCKNQRLLIDSFNELHKQGKNVALVIIGAHFDNDKGLELKRMANPTIHFLGLKTNVYDYLRCADIFCLSSDYEGMPMSMIEAILSGLPMVATPVCGAFDAIIPGKNGFISQSHNMRDYLCALNNAIDNIESVKAFASSYKDVCPYTIENCTQNYIKYFKEGI